MATGIETKLDSLVESFHQAQPHVASSQEANSPETEYDFVVQPDQDYFCPVSLDVLCEPQQTSCCGQHISKQAVRLLLSKGKPCPLCKSETFTVHDDKYFLRKVKELKVRCPYKMSGCTWEGELGDLDLHITSCPKRPWKCQHCNFEAIYEVGASEHTPSCTKYPESCPNGCRVESIIRCDMDKHLLVCSLQLVDCEYAHAGCDVKVPRGDLAKHVTENVQHHLLSATLLNLQLSRELHHKMEEKDQQIAELEMKLAEKDSEMSRSLNHLNKLIILSTQGFSCHDFQFTEFEKRRANKTTWHSPKVYSSHRGYCFKLNISLSGVWEDGTLHLVPSISSERGAYDKELKWPIRCTLQLMLINQQNDRKNLIMIFGAIFFRAGILKLFSLRTSAKFPIGRESWSEFIADDALQFRLLLQVQPLL